MLFIQVRPLLNENPKGHCVNAAVVDLQAPSLREYPARHVCDVVALTVDVHVEPLITYPAWHWYNVAV